MESACSKELKKRVSRICTGKRGNYQIGEGIDVSGLALLFDGADGSLELLQALTFQEGLEVVNELLLLILAHLQFLVLVLLHIILLNLLRPLLLLLLHKSTLIRFEPLNPCSTLPSCSPPKHPFLLIRSVPIGSHPRSLFLLFLFLLPLKVVELPLFVELLLNVRVGLVRPDVLPRALLVDFVILLYHIRIRGSFLLCSEEV